METMSAKNRMGGVVIGVVLLLAAVPVGAQQRAAVQERAVVEQRAAVQAQEEARRQAMEARAHELRLREIEVREALLQEDPASGLYREARDALRAREYRRAAELFAQIRESHPESAYAADSYYYQALALQRAGGMEELRRAAELLAIQEQEHLTAAEVQEAKALQLRIQSEMARRGSASSYAYMEQRAEQSCGEEDELRLAALAALVSVDAEKATPILLEVLQERDECSVELRQQAISLLGQHPGALDADLLAELIRSDPDPEVRQAAVFWLGQVEGPGRSAALRSVLESEDDPQIQAQAIHALARGGGQDVAEILIEYARRTDVDPEVRAQAVFALGQIPDAETGQVLRDLYGSVDGELKAQVLYAMAAGDGDATTEFLTSVAMDPEEELEVRVNALYWLSQHDGALAADDLMRLYRETSELELKQHLLMMAAHLDDPVAFDLLAEAARDPEHPELREHAIMLLGQSEDPRAAAVLMELVRGG
jgi:HEAT repeat protein